MSIEAASSLLIEPAPVIQAFETIETADTIAATIRHIVATHVDKVALVTIALFFVTDAKTNANLRAYTEPPASTRHLLNNLRPLVRRTDLVFLLDNTMHFLLPGADLQGGEIVQSRLWDALLWRIHNTTDREIARPTEITIGHSAYPAPQQTTGELIEAASEVRLRSNFTVGRSTRKALARQALVRKARLAQHQSADDELPALARKLGIPYLSLLPNKTPERVQQLVNARLAQELHCYPVGRERNILTVAMLYPQDHAALERLQQETGLIIFPVLTHPKALQTALDQLF